MIALVILCAALLYLSPGALMHALWRDEHRLTLPVCLGLGVAAIIVIDVWLASMVGYIFALQIAANVLLIAALAWAARLKLHSWWQWARGQFPWPGLGWLAVVAVFLAPAFVVQLPFDTDAQGFALLALTVQLGGSITAMSPLYPEINYLYSPGFFLLSAQLADLLGGAMMPKVVMGLGHVLAVATVAGVYAVGREFGDARVGAWAAIFSAGGFALFSTMMDSAYTNVLGNFLTAAILVLLFRAMRQPTLAHIALAAVALASLPLSHPDSIVHLLMAYVPFYFTVWLSREKFSWRQYATLTVIVPAIGVALCLPWVARVLPLVGGIDVHERQNPIWSHMISLVMLNGVAPPLLAVGGLIIAAWRRRWFDLWLITWAVAILEVSSFGTLDAWSRQSQIDPMQIMYPFGVAWHATLIPVPMLAAMAVCAVPNVGALAEKWGLTNRRLQTALAVSSGVVIVGAALAALFSEPIIQYSKGRAHITGSLSSPADVQAMLWLKENTPPEALILNAPGIEGDWAPVIAERRTVQFREQLFYVGAKPAWAVQAALEPAYLHPASSYAEQAIRAAGVDYLLVPQVIGNPHAFGAMLRWRPPFIQLPASSFADAPYLELMQDFDGAQIYRVK